MFICMQALRAVCRHRLCDSSCGAHMCVACAMQGQSCIALCVVAEWASVHYRKLAMEDDGSHLFFLLFPSWLKQCSLSVRHSAAAVTVAGDSPPFFGGSSKQAHCCRC